uniref:Glycosyl transferase family 2 n=1 Tax=uncultured Thiotrichaceae bacterium TaxID=298394 RepID=A0A6S6U6E5_9GAMM|nr:MAG: Glycosyl transferase family 2 [uncultured Thiotrichaceae bacterium]
MWWVVGLTLMLSIIVPVAPGDDSWQVVLQDFSGQFVQEQLVNCELLFIGSDEAEMSAIQGEIDNDSAGFNQCARAECAGNSRATAMNAGAQLAVNEFLWFVHADSRIEARHIDALKASIRDHPEALHYFDLRFYGHPMMWLNSLGVWLRSHWLATPFGDQALCMTKRDFLRIGAYPEDVAYGEDHALVWHALQQGIKLRCTGTALLTSARKYEQNGWLKTTGLHVGLWAKQAWPEFQLLLKQKVGRQGPDA